MYKGDEVLVKHVSILANLFSDYGKESNEISKCLANLSAKLKAITNPTAENKLTAISLPEPTVLSDKLAECLSTLKQMKKEIEERVKEIDKALESRKVECDACGGKGYITKPIRDKDYPVIQYEEIKCANCENGFLPLSRESSDIVKLVFKSFS